MCENVVFYAQHCARLDSAFSDESWLRFLIFFFFLAALFDQVNREQCTHALFTDPQIPLFSAIFSLKMGPTTLFTHLKIILLQCFQFQQK